MAQHRVLWQDLVNMVINPWFVFGGIQWYLMPAYFVVRKKIKLKMDLNLSILLHE
jgi:hypothetical protein